MTISSLRAILSPLFLIFFTSNVIAQSVRPNIILIMADDLGYETLECNGGTSYKTPQLNKMAGTGMRFNECHATPLCTPSRVQLMTGKYNFRNYIGFGLLDPAERTFAHLLKDAGYVTGITGKWQLRGLDFEQAEAGNRRGSYPVEAGFDEYCLWQVDARNSRYKDPSIKTNGKPTIEMKGKYGPDIFADFAKDFITKHRDTTFFLYYPMVLVHNPFQPTPTDPAFKNTTEKKPDDSSYFGDLVSYVDKISGEIIDKVKELGISRNTLIIFLGDNGTSPHIISSANGIKIQGDKSGFTRYATHVPLIASWEGTIQPGSVNESLIDLTDFIPTFAEIAGAEQSPGWFFDGLSFYSQLRSRANAKEREWIFCSYDPRRGNRKAGTWIHNKNWKLFKTGEFYHISVDPLEKNPIPDSALDENTLAIKLQLQKAMEDIYKK